MTPNSCSFCGSLVRISSIRNDEPVYCCSGCALAARIPVNDGNLPVSGGLVMALVLAVAYFNQFLLWSLAFVMRVEERDILSGRFDAISLAMGMVVLVAAIGAVLSARVHRWKDWIVLALVAGLAVIGSTVGFKMGPSSTVDWALATNTIMMTILSRGLLKKLLVRRKLVLAQRR